jgi:N-acetylglucosaminyldiphosphoundecaprenol N-acetyl-beta-D-mannosaminyltransferase
MLNEKVNILGLDIDNVSMHETIEKIDLLIRENQSALIFTPNVQRLVYGIRDKQTENIYKQADMLIPDGMPLIWASKLLGVPLKEKVSGSDLLPLFCQAASKKGHKMFFLGADPGIAEEAKNILAHKNPGLQIVGTYSPPYGFENMDGEIEKIIKMIKGKNPHVLFVGLGFPKEERFMWKHKDDFQVPVSIGIGATFDFITGKQRRAPVWMQKGGLEWFHRLCHDPKRLWKRYLVGNSLFIFLISREFLRKRILRKKGTR